VPSRSPTAINDDPWRDRKWLRVAKVVKEEERKLSTMVLCSRWGFRSRLVCGGFWTLGCLRQQVWYKRGLCSAVWVCPQAKEERGSHGSVGCGLQGELVQSRGLDEGGPSAAVWEGTALTGVFAVGSVGAATGTAVAVGKGVVMLRPKGEWAMAEGCSWPEKLVDLGDLPGWLCVACWMGGRDSGA